jgi:hypothetical protein
LSILAQEFQSPTRLIVLVLLLVIVIDFRARLRLRARKNPDRKVDPGFWNFYPAGAVQVDLPFPFGKRRMTVA